MVLLAMLQHCGCLQLWTAVGLLLLACCCWLTAPAAGDVFDDDDVFDVLLLVGAELVASIATLHARRGRLLWLKQQGWQASFLAAEGSSGGRGGRGGDDDGVSDDDNNVQRLPDVLTLLEMRERIFLRQFDGYPGDAEVLQQTNEQ